MVGGHRQLAGGEILDKGRPLLMICAQSCSQPPYLLVGMHDLKKKWSPREQKAMLCFANDTLHCKVVLPTV